MPGDRGEAARGAPQRGNVPHHGFLGRTGDLRRQAASLRLTVSDAGDRVGAAVELRNEGAGHRIPTGLPERRLVLRVRTLADSGAELDRGERSYGRVLVDASGTPVPFPSAVRVAADDRLAPGEVRQERFQLRAPSSGRVRLELIWQAADPALARTLGVAAPREEVIGELELGFGPPGSAGRKSLPRTVNTGR
jgi:hypothetical protein